MGVILRGFPKDSVVLHGISHKGLVEMCGYFGQVSMGHVRWSNVESLMLSLDTPVKSLESSHSPRVESLESSRVT